MIRDHHTGRCRLRHRYSTRRQDGAVTVEFALTFMVFWVCFLAVIEFSRLMFVWGTAAEATQKAARLASICEIDITQEARIRDAVSKFVTASGQVDLATRTDWLTFSYLPAGCTKLTCTQVEVALNNVSAQLLAPLPVTTVNLPAYKTRHARETMSNSMGSEQNDVCN